MTGRHGSAAGRRWLGVLVGVAMLATTLPGSSQTAPADTLQIVKQETFPSNVQVAATIASETFQTAPRVLVARDDDFADALASGVLQSDAPLLLVPSTGPLPAEVREQIAALEPPEAIVLGGTSAVSPAVAEELQDLGMTVERRQGATRFETALDIASTDAADADTVLLARATGTPEDPSTAYADTLAAGGIAARLGHPILLTQTSQLNAATRAYLEASSTIRRVLVLGGTAAISSAVQDELVSLGLQVERIAGASRAETAIEIAKIGGDQSAAEAPRVIVTTGSDPAPSTFAGPGAPAPAAWAAGFALASHAARFDAPIVLAVGSSLPEPTRAFLSTGIGGDPSQAPVLTCAVVPSVCEEARVAAQLPPAPPPAEGPVLGANVIPQGAERMTFGTYTTTCPVSGRVGPVASFVGFYPDPASRVIIPTQLGRTSRSLSCTVTVESPPELTGHEWSAGTLVDGQPVVLASGTGTVAQLDLEVPEGAAGITVAWTGTLTAPPTVPPGQPSDSVLVLVFAQQGITDWSITCDDGTTFDPAAGGGRQVSSGATCTVVTGGSAQARVGIPNAEDMTGSEVQFTVDGTLPGPVVLIGNPA